MSEADDWVKKAQGWTVNNFSIADHRGNVPALLRKVARYISQLGDVEVMGLTYHFEAGYPRDTCTITVLLVPEGRG
jgi:hypothetical protein